MLNRKAAIVVALLFVSLFSTPAPSIAETKKTKVTNTTVGNNSSAAKKDKVEKIKCKTTRATAQSPARIAPPSGAARATIFFTARRAYTARAAIFFTA